MDKTIISLNVPNFITINLMAWFGLLILVILYQTAFKRGSNQTASNSGGY